ncbi:MAG: dienelactone hydrolase family protein [Alphaproteobacteria bacterium]|nr:dienelactone hydrolase family protein [Alphaproteobacteria bacterium]
MGETVRITAEDGFAFDAYVARPAAPTRRAVVVIQEIFGVNAHIRGVADSYAAQGFLAVAPALFDRRQAGVELGYDAEGIKRGVEIAYGIGEAALTDVAAAIAWARTETGANPGVVGYCWGGSLAWLAATRLVPDADAPAEAGALVGPAAVVSYYGRLVPDHADEEPRCPVILHFGTRDASIPLDRVEAFRAARPEATVHIYEAGHGFNCEARGDHDPAAAALAAERTLAFFRSHMPD